MPRAILADDEPMMRAALRDQLATLWPELEVVAEAEDGPTALVRIEAMNPDVVFLDIRMPGMTGLEVARAMTSKARVVFVTAFESHAVEAFEANAVDYVLKPLDVARLAKVIAKLRKSLADAAPASLEQLLEALKQLGVAPPQGAAASETGRAAVAAAVDAGDLQWLKVSVGQSVHMVHLHDVIYFESDTKYTRVVTHDVEGLLRLTLKELTGAAGGSVFLQTHRSTVVNRRFIRAVHRRGEVVEIELKGRPERLKVSTANHPLFKAM
jgi:DNA-binding LytR/AlgR family response regulator